MAVVIVIIVLLILAILTYLIYSLNLFSFFTTKNDEEEDESEMDEDPDGDGYQDEQGDAEQGELVDLFEMFAEDDEQDGGNLAVQHEIHDEDERAYDKLTELMSYYTYLSECSKILDVARQNSASYAVAYLDIDRFRFINSIKGYSLGDFVLTHLAQELKVIFPEGSHFTRISADHFSVLFSVKPGQSFEGYSELIKKVCEKIRADMAIKSSIRVCMGIALTESPSNPISYNISVLLHKANIARHCLKVTKSESYSVYDETMISSYLYGTSLMDDYSENQYGDELVIRFQSITDLNRKHIAGCDTLVRWSCQEDTAEEPLNADNGRIPTNVTKIIYHTCRAASRWRKMEKEVIPLYIYITVTEFFSPDLDEFIAKCLSEFQLEPGIVNIVVDVNVVRIDWTIANRQIKRLRDIGLKVGVSGIDVNTISLEFLAGLPINFVKLNSSFSRGISKIPDKAGAVRAMIVMAQAQNLRAIFEGVNTIDQMQEHMNLGSGLVEGRSNGLPMLADEFMKMLDNESASAKGLDSTVILKEIDFNQGDYHL